jgi:uncharacterized protein
MKILLDTNVLLSAAWRDRLPEKVVLRVATSSECQWVVTSEILAEYGDVLKRPKFGFSESLLQQWLDLIQMRTLLIPSPVAVSLPRDPKDAMFLAAAVAANADYLITGDKDLLQAKWVITAQIVTPVDFAAAFGIQ